MNYKYFLFDWDGTLCRTLDVWLSAYITVAKTHNIDLYGKTNKELVSIFFGKLGEGYKEFGITDTEAAYEEVKRIVDINVVNAPIYPNAKTVLERLVRSDKRLALHTTSNRNLLYPVIKNSGLEKYFETILTKDDVVNAKPDPEVILKEISYFKAAPEDCLVVGDSASDLIAAQAAKVDSLLVYSDSHKDFYNLGDLKKHNPTFIVGNLLEILEVVN